MFYGEENKEHLMVMDLLGTSLAKELLRKVKCPITGDEVKKEKLSFKETANVAIQVIKQIQVLHGHNLLHSKSVNSLIF